MLSGNARISKQKRKIYSTPNINKDYNAEITGIDPSDQMLSNYSTMKKQYNKNSFTHY